MLPFRELFRIYVIDPILSPDLSAILKGFLPAVGIALGSFMFTESFALSDYTIPFLAFLYGYMHSYDHQKHGSVAQEIKLEEELTPIEGNINETVNSDLDLDLLWTELKMMQGALSKDIDTLVILDIDRNNTKDLFPFNSIAKRWTAERMAFIAASRDGARACSEFIRMSNTTIDIPIASDANFLNSMNQQSSTARRRIVVFKVDESKQMKILWEGHVGCLEPCLHRLFGSDSE